MHVLLLIPNSHRRKMRAFSKLGRKWLLVFISKILPLHFKNICQHANNTTFRMFSYVFFSFFQVRIFGRNWHRKNGSKGAFWKAVSFIFVIFGKCSQSSITLHLFSTMKFAEKLSRKSSFQRLTFILFPKTFQFLIGWI